MSTRMTDPETEQPAQQEDRRMAVTSLALGLLSFAGGGPLLAVPAVVLGHGARRKVRAKTMDPRAKPLATAGLVLGYLNLALCAGLLGYVFAIYYQLVAASVALPGR